MPFEVPEGWCWCTLDDLAFYKKGPFGSSLTKSMFVPDTPFAYKVYEQKNAIQKDHTLGSYFIDENKYRELKGFSVEPCDIIVSCAGTIGETYVMPNDIRAGIINQALMLIRLHLKDIQEFYLLYFDFILKAEAAKESKGTAIKNIPPFDVLKSFLIPLPPLAEQGRILKEVNGLTSFVDSIDESTKDISSLISSAKSKVLELAIHGKLVPQDPTDEPASELLKRINPNAVISCDNPQYQNHFEIPDSWKWCLINDLFEITMGQSPEGETYNNTCGIEFHQGKINFTERYLDKSGVFTTKPTKIAQAGSILMCVRAPVGIINITQREVCIGRGLCALKCKDIIDPDYAFYALQTIQSELESKATGSTFKAISCGIIRDESLPLPPYEEQKRIVLKIQELNECICSILNQIEARENHVSI